jgi:predicted metal-binding membrane protein
VRLGIRCSYGCAGLTASLLAVGLMDPRAMAAVTAAVTAERLAPGGRHVARVVGAVGLAVGSFLMLHARAFI